MPKITEAAWIVTALHSIIMADHDSRYFAIESKDAEMS